MGIRVFLPHSILPIPVKIDGEASILDFLVEADSYTQPSFAS